MFEEKQLLYDILHAQKDESLAVTIGQENKYNDIKDCSIISATYHLDGKPIATLAVLGQRMIMQNNFFIKIYEC